MGHIRHDAIIITSWKHEVLDAVVAKARDLGLPAVLQEGESINGYRTALVCPDGSKEGWPESDAGDDSRGALIGFLRTFRYEDESSPLDWVAVRYGNDDERAEVVDHEWVDVESRRGMGVAESPCPDKGRCHGCMAWCDKCGDVGAGNCDDPTCDVHRGQSGGSDGR